MEKKTKEVLIGIYFQYWRFYALNPNYGLERSEKRLESG